MKHLIWSLIAATALCLTGPAKAQEITLGAGYTDYTTGGMDSGLLSLEYRHTPFFQRNRLTAAFAANISTTEESDHFIGAGLALRWAWTSGWFVDFSVMPGYYDHGPLVNSLGNDFNFRSLLGVGYQFESGQSLSLSVTHKSNAGIDSINPGMDVLLLRYHLPL